jgi:hypothetical protein
MAGQEKSFKDLLGEAPLAAKSDTVCVVGTLARSPEPGKFVLTPSGGEPMTLEIDAVKGHTVLAGAVGQTLVRVDLDAARVPESLREDLTRPIHKIPYLDQTGYFDHSGILDITGFLQDISHPGFGTDPIGGPVPFPGPDPGPLMEMQARHIFHTVPEKDNTGYYFDTPGPSPWLGTVPDPFPVSPFIMATPHHASAAQIAALQGGAYPAGAAVAPFMFQTLPQFDHTTPFLDRPKRPTEDGTIGTHRDF